MVRIMYQNSKVVYSGDDSKDSYDEMIRLKEQLICQGLNTSFINGEMARRAVDAVSPVNVDNNNDNNFNFRNFDQFNSPSASGSSTPFDSSCESDGDVSSGQSPLVINMDDSSNMDSNDDLETKEQKRRARRRERNKASAQAYRLRRKRHASDQSQTLADLMARNKELHGQIKQLEEEKHFVEELLKKKIQIPWHCLTKIWDTTPTTIPTGPVVPTPPAPVMVVPSMVAPMSMCTGSTEVTCAS